MRMHLLSVCHVDSILAAAAADARWKQLMTVLLHPCARLDVVCCGSLPVQELLGSNDNRQELLQSVWRAFLILAEHCMKVRIPTCPAAAATCASASSRGADLPCSSSSHLHQR